MEMSTVGFYADFGPPLFVSGGRMINRRGVKRILIGYLLNLMLKSVASLSGDIKRIRAIFLAVASISPLAMAAMLIVFLTYVGLRAYEEEKVLDLVVKLQALGAGVAALAASLIAYHGAGANAREARRKDAVERAERDRSLLVRTRHSSHNLIPLMNRLRQQVYAEMKGPPGRRKLKVAFPQAETISEAWAHIGVLPMEIEEPLSLIMSSLERGHDLSETSTQMDDDGEGGRLEYFADEMLPLINTIEGAAKDIVAITSARMSGVPVPAYRIIDALREGLLPD